MSARLAVAQICDLLYRGLVVRWASVAFGSAAGYKPAIRQITNLRYFALCTLLSFISVTAVPAQNSTNNAANVRFIAVDIFVNSSNQSLAAYQLEFAATNGVAKIVGIEGGEHPAFREAPHYEPKAMQSDRVIIAAYSTDNQLPVGKTRVATIHLQVTGDSPQFGIHLETAGNSAGNKIEAEATFEERKNK